MYPRLGAVGSAERRLAGSFHTISRCVQCPKTIYSREDWRESGSRVRKASYLAIVRGVTVLAATLAAEALTGSFAAAAAVMETELETRSSKCENRLDACYDVANQYITM